MFGSTVLEIAIGLIFVYSLLSLLCSTINEQVITKLLALRAKTLEDGIKTMLKTIPNSPTGQELTKKFYEHPLIQSLAPEASKPSYISARTFALALKDVLTNAGTDLSTIPALKPVLDQVDHDAQQELASIEGWYNETMDRVSGWYKRKVQLIILLLGLVITISLNVDTISLVTSLSNSSALRATIVSAAQGSANTQTDTNVAALQNRIEQIQPAIGWSLSTLPADAGELVIKNRWTIDHDLCYIPGCTILV